MRRAATPTRVARTPRLFKRQRLAAVRIALGLITERAHSARPDVRKSVKRRYGLRANALPAQILVYQRVSEPIRKRVGEHAGQPHEHARTKVIENIRPRTVGERHLEGRDFQPAFQECRVLLKCAVPRGVRHNRSDRSVPKRNLDRPHGNVSRRSTHSFRPF